MNRNDMTQLEFDAFQEVGNVGAGNAATALSTLLNRLIAIDIPETKFIPLTTFAHEFGGPELMVRSVYMDINGDLKGDIFFFFEKEPMLNLVDMMMGNEPGTTTEIDDNAESAFGEMTNIFAGAYLTSLSDMLDFNIMPGVPHHNYDMLQSILDQVIAEKSLITNEILSIKSIINTESNEVKGNFILMFDEESLQKIIHALNTKFGIELNE